MNEDICQLGAIQCTDDQHPNQCVCTHVVPLNNSFATVQFVLSSIGGGSTYHPIHLHGHSFQVHSWHLLW